MAEFKPDPFVPLRTQSPLVEAVLRQARLIAGAEVTVLVQGETGTGKDLLARALHAASARASRPFVPVNCAALPDGLVESELFGHRKGAFTGAHQASDGLVRAAEGGVLFLDEVAELPLAAQAKLLRVLENQEVHPVGEGRAVPVDIRVIAATHRDLDAWVRQGRFREDLYYRLHVVPLELPPLRQREGDIAALTRHFLAQFAAELRLRPAMLEPKALEALRRHSWPGNVRELRNLCQRLAVLRAGEVVTTADLPKWQRGSASDSSAAIALPEQGVCLEQVEIELIRQALARTGGNKSRAARLLGLSRDALLYRIKTRPALAGDWGPACA